MMTFIIKIKNYLKTLIDKNKNYLHLNTIKYINNKIVCEFNEILRLDGKLIKINIDDIAKNKNILRSIAPETLFIIGKIYGKYESSLQQYRLKTIDVQNNSVIIDNNSELIQIKIEELLHDTELLKQLNQLDLVKILYSFIHKQGYEFHAKICEYESSKSLYDSNLNVVNLFKKS